MENLFERLNPQVAENIQKRVSRKIYVEGYEAILERKADTILKVLKESNNINNLTLGQIVDLGHFTSEPLLRLLDVFRLFENGDRIEQLP